MKIKIITQAGKASIQIIGEPAKQFLLNLDGEHWIEVCEPSPTKAQSWWFGQLVLMYQKEMTTAGHYISADSARENIMTVMGCKYTSFESVPIAERSALIDSVQVMLVELTGGRVQF